MDQKPRPRSFRFGVLRTGLLLERYPRSAGLAAILVIAVAVFGLFHVSVDRDLHNIFRGDNDTYQTYLATAAQFVDPDNQVLILIEGEAIGSPLGLEQLFDLHLELQLLPDAGSVYSLFSLRTSPDADGRTRPLVEDPGAGLEPALIAAIRAHPILGQSVLSADGSAMLFVIAHATANASLAEHDALIGELRELVSSELPGVELKATITGFATLRTEIVRLLKRDQIVLNGSGALIGLILSLVLFRSIAAALMTALPGAMAGLMLVGWNGALGVPVTLLSNVVPALIMVIGYADAMHLSSAFRRHRARGLSTVKAERHALSEAGPACILSAITTVVAFVSMAFSDLDILRDFAIVGSIGTFLGAWVVVLGHALLARLIGRFWRIGAGAPASPLDALSAPVARLTGWVVGRAWPISIASIPLTLALGTLLLLVPAEYSIRETLPPGGGSVRALNVIDGRLGGAFPVQIVVPLHGARPDSPEALALVRAVHEAVGAVAGVSAPLSLWSLAAWLGEGAEPAATRLAATLAEMPDEVRQRFHAGDMALVTVNIRDQSTADTKRLVDAIDAAAVAAAPGAIVTGSTVVGAREATRAINNLSTSFGSAIVVALVLMAIALRSVGVGIVAAIPNVLPIAVTGALLFILGTGMQLTSIISLTIAFGIAVDDTIHYLNLLLRQRGRLRDRLVATSRQVGGVLIGTTIVIVAGLTMTLTSGLATVVNFGLLTMATLAVGMLGDLIVLPALIAGPARRLFGERGTSQAAADAPSPTPRPEMTRPGGVP